MNFAQCQQAMNAVGTGVSASLRAVDCAANATAQTAFGRLFGSDGALLPALTILLTLYVGFFALSLIAGRGRLGISALTPRMLTLGLVLTFATSWAAYQGVVWNLAVGAPDQVASVLTGSSGSATDGFANKIDLVFARLVEASGDTDAPTSTYSPLGLLWLGATLLLLGTVGVLVTSKIALAILLALGPVFVVLALFRGTRGLFVGWLKGMVLLALAPLFAVLGGSMILELAVPVLSALAPTVPGEINPQAAMAFFVLGAVHVALMAIILSVASTMVSGWTVFGLAGSSERESDTRPTGASGALPVAAAAAGSAAAQARTGAPAPAREIRLSQAPRAANDAGSGESTGHGRIKIVATGGPAVAGQPASASPIARARGIGSRFRAAPARSMEKFK
ncbi:MAG TPA: type IV secretion system protein [Croceibacterium sp.]|nr:type IV secretion system protein [Croceibacterium sp.]